MHSLRTAYEDEPLNKSALFSHADLLRDPHAKIPLSSLFFLSFPLPLPFTPHSLSLPTPHPPSPTLPLLSTLSPIHTPSRRRCSWAKAAAVGLGDGRRGWEGSQRWRRRKGWIQSPLPPPTHVDPPAVEMGLADPMVAATGGQWKRCCHRQWRREDEDDDDGDERILGLGLGFQSRFSIFGIFYCIFSFRSGGVKCPHVNKNQFLHAGDMWFLYHMQNMFFVDTWTQAGHRKKSNI